jgi:succinoglycan biosynthesis transport protein ExoP
MEIIDFFGIIQRRKWVVITTALFASIVTVILALTTPPTYASTTTIRVLTTKAGGADYVDYDIQYSERLMGTYIEIATSSPLLNELSTLVYRLPKISTRIIPNTELIELTAEDPDPGLAQFSANKLAELLIKRSREVEIGSVSPVTIYVVEPADLPNEPSSPNKYLVMALGLLLGIVGGIGLALIFDNLDTRLYSKKQMEVVSGLPILGDIPEDKHLKTKKTMLYNQPGIFSDAFRRLRTNLFSNQKNENIKHLLVTSPVVSDGRTEIASNLALSLALNNKKVLLVDANLRAPAIHKLFNLDNEHGLTTYTEEGADQIVQKTEYPNLDVITAGLAKVNPVDFLDSALVRDLQKEYHDRYDYIILDSPSCITATDAVVLAGLVDAVLLVVRQSWVRKEALQTTLKYLESVDANVVGIVVNRTELGVKK